MFRLLVGLALAFVGAFAPLLPAFFPRIGVGCLRRFSWPHPARRLLGVAGFGLVLFDFVRSPSLLRGAALLPAGWFAFLAQFLEPKRIFVQLNYPPHVDALEADLGKEALVLGVNLDGNAHAWSYESLVPRHLINDIIGGIPALAAY